MWRSSLHQPFRLKATNATRQPFDDVLALSRFLFTGEENTALHFRKLSQGGAKVLRVPREEPVGLRYGFDRFHRAAG